MLKPAKMKKVRVYVLKSRLPAVIKSLHEAGVMEIRRFRTEGLESGRPLEFFDEVSTRLVRLRNMISNMDQQTVKSTKAKRPQLDEKTAVTEAENLHSAAGLRLKEIANETSSLGEDVSRLTSQLALIQKLEVFKGIDFSELSTKRLGFMLGEVPIAKAETLKKKIKEMKGQYSILSPEKSNLMLVLYGRDSAPIDSILVESGFSAIQLPEGMRTPESEYSKLKVELDEKKAVLKKLELERKMLSEKYAKKAMELIEILNVESERSEISSRFAVSSRTAVIQGWIQEKDFAKLKKTIDAFGNDAAMEEAGIEEHEQPPVVIENAGLANPFEYVTKAYSLPNYFELDPTIIYFIGLPIIYGLIVGDVIYGIISVFLSLYLLKIFKNSYTMTNVSKIWLYSSTFAILFGLLFDEWGGMSHFGWFELLSDWGIKIISAPLYTGWFSRLHDFPFLLGVTLVVGLLHLGIGFILGAVNQWHHHRKHAYAKLAWLGVEITGTVAVASGFLGLMPAAFFIPSLVGLVIAVIALILTEGAIGALEIPGLAGNVLSYARIAAVGVVGVVLAEIINEVLLPVPEAGLLAILFLPLLVLLHMVNTFIAMFEALIQGGRLNVIEFRSKFLQGGGVLFNPFTLKK